MITLGRHTYFADAEPKLKMWAPEERIKIGSFCSIGADVAIFAGGQHRMLCASTFPFDAVFAGVKVPRSYQTTRATVIGNDVWVGTRATVLGGARIGHGAIIGAGAVVRGKVPPYAVVYGNPAEVLCYRFSPQTIERLLKLAWWDWSDRKIAANLDWFFEPIEEFLSYFEAP